jgi:hypothetical protein
MSGNDMLPGSLGTKIDKAFDIEIARTGLQYLKT